MLLQIANGVRNITVYCKTNTGIWSKNIIVIIIINCVGKGQNYEFHNVEIQKERRKKFKASERRKWLLSFSLLRNQNVEKNIKIKTFDVLILPMDLKLIRTSKIYVWTTYGVLPMVTKACGGLG